MMAVGKTALQKLQVISMVLLLVSSATMAQWNTQSPLPTNLDVRGIGAPTPDRVFIATDDNSFDNSGALFESNDGGASWVQRDIPFSLFNPFYGLFFLDSQHGWAYGNENYRTTDGGTTWTELPLLGSTYFMKFYTPDFGLATGNFGQYVSMDGGISWNESPNGMSAFDFSDNLNGIGAAPTGIYSTSDGGTSFNPVYSGNVSSVAFLSATVAVGIADDVFVRSTDGGLSWVSGTSASGRSQLLPLSTSVVLAWGRSGDFPDYDDRILRSADGGLTWTDLGEPVPEGIYNFGIADTQNVVASDNFGNIFHSSDAGLTWLQTFTSPGPMPGYLSSVAPVFSGSTGYFGYGAGFIIKTADSGASWTQISSGSGTSLNDIGRFPDGSLIAVGENGTVLSSDGTSPWINHQTFTQFHLKAVHIIDQQNLVVVDESGQVYKSADNGLTWVATLSKPDDFSTVEDIHFTDINNGWVTGQGYNNGALYRTTDGGDTWTPVPDILGAYVAVDVEGANIWAANVTGLFYRSSDNGATWNQAVLPGIPNQIRDMDFFDENTGYAVGMYGEAFRSTDGGLNWETLPTPNTFDDFTDIFLVGADEFWLSTNSNLVYYTATGGQNWAVYGNRICRFRQFQRHCSQCGRRCLDRWLPGLY